MTIDTVNIGKSFVMAYLIRYAERVETSNGNVYYRFNGWFQQLPDDFEFILHREDLPSDLSEYLCRSGLGGDNPKIEKPKI